MKKAAWNRRKIKIEFVRKHKCNTCGYVEGSSTFQPSLGEFIYQLQKSFWNKSDSSFIKLPAQRYVTAVSKLIIVKIYVCTLAESILCVHAYEDQLILGSPRCWWSHFKNYIWNINTTLLLPFVSSCVTIWKIIRNHLLSQKIIYCKWKTCFEHS